MYTTSRMDLVKKIECAANFDADKMFSILYQYLAFRKLIAERLLEGGEHDTIIELEKLLEITNTQIKLFMGL